MFHIHKLAVITQKTFPHHQERYLQPAIGIIWRDSQKNLFSKPMASDCSLKLAGDEQSNNPRHSAKYGLYSVLKQN